MKNELLLLPESRKTYLPFFVSSCRAREGVEVQALIDDLGLYDLSLPLYLREKESRGRAVPTRVSFAAERALYEKDASRIRPRAHYRVDRRLFDVFAYQPSLDGFTE